MERGEASLLRILSAAAHPSLDDPSSHQRKQDPVITVYESKPNLADHEKIQGTVGNFSMPSQ
jgi:hypothetical protein